MNTSQREQWLQDSVNNVYVGRPSRYGNPYKVGCYTREEAVSLYKSHKLQTLSVDDLNFLRNKQLGCFCHPKLCHADILIEALGV